MRSDTSYPVKMHVEVNSRFSSAGGRLEISPGQLIVWFGARMMATSVENFVNHRHHDVHVFVSHDWPLREVISIALESPEMSVVVRPTFHRAESVMRTLRECGFEPVVERASASLRFRPRRLLRQISRPDPPGRTGSDD
jgi:hypothetical protein